MSHDAQAKIGQTIDRYVVEALLGEGGFGAVYRARHVMMNRQVALKLLHPDLVSDEAIRERFLREAQAAAAVGHPNIVQMFDCGVAVSGEAFLAMELLPGEDLQARLERVRRFQWPDAVGLCLEVLDALTAAHAAGVVHRDLKPGNVFITTSGQVKLLDFGISKLERSGVPKLTQTGVVMGTPHYMAPETFSGAHDVDQRADLYSVAAMLFEMLSGAPPHDADTYERLVIKVATMPAPSARTISSLPVALADALDRGLAAEPGSRWATAAEFAQALRAIKSTGSVDFATVDDSVRSPALGTARTGLAMTPSQPGLGFGAPLASPSPTPQPVASATAPAPLPATNEHSAAQAPMFGAAQPAPTFGAPQAQTTPALGAPHAAPPHAAPPRAAPQSGPQTAPGYHRAPHAASESKTAVWIALGAVATLAVLALVGGGSWWALRDSEPEVAIAPPVAPQTGFAQTPLGAQAVTSRPQAAVNPSLPPAPPPIPIEPISPNVPAAPPVTPPPIAPATPIAPTPIAPTPAPIERLRVTTDRVLGMDFGDAGSLAMRANDSLVRACGTSTPQVVRVLLMRGPGGRIAIAREANEDPGDPPTARCVASQLAALGPMGTEAGGMAVFRVELPAR